MEWNTLKNNKFDIDLKYGQEREQRLASILDKDKNKIEVKTERDWWFKTGNIAIEVECNGKPSGIMATKADYWVHILAEGDKDYCRLIFDTRTIKRLAKKYIGTLKNGGDGWRSRFVLIPLAEIFLPKNLSKSMQERIVK
ncbi:hypothetical protein Jormungand_gp10 [Pelagibacter phage Jormungand EXVC012P]|nr:hypothetical protein Jormungand_gp10 [Pelagibacter phage Jormungand EXVC012P]